MTPADHYGITGSTLSFVTTPANNDYVEVTTLSGYGATGYTGSTGTGYTGSTGTGYTGSAGTQGTTGYTGSAGSGGGGGTANTSTIFGYNILFGG